MSYQHYPPPGYGSTYPPPPGYSSAYDHGHGQGHPPQYMGLGLPYPPPLVAAAADPYSYRPQPQPQHPGGYQGYFAPDQYPPPSPHSNIPYQVYHCQHDDDHDDCSSFLRGCVAALCFCCVLEECF